MKDEIAEGYAIAALFTHGVDGAPGEYQADPEKVEYLREHALEAAGAFLHLAGSQIQTAIDRGILDAERVGNCLHYDREGHGVGFTDEGNKDQAWLMGSLAKVAQSMGEDYVLADLILCEVERGDWYSDSWPRD